uniref:TAFII55 protein conserved region domain-containing protein n=1 Tax=Triticum urartu TaxID=4572 RepID=A0A8R7PU31_TRIUA
MDEQFILRVPPSVAEQIERLMNESAAGSSSNPDDASLDLSFSEDGRSGTFMIGNQRFPASLLDLPTVVESYKTYDDSFLVKTADIGQVKVKIYVYILLICRPHNHFKLEQMIMVREEDDPAPEGVEYKHGLTPPMRDARRRRFRREPDLSAELVHRVEKDLISIMQGVPVNQNVGVAGGGEGGDRKKAAPAPAPKPDVQEPAANGEEAEADRSDSDESDS